MSYSARKSDVLYLIILMNLTAFSTSLPLFFNDAWVNLFLTTLVTPFVFMLIGRGGEFTRLGLDYKFFLLTMFFTLGLTAAVLGGSKKVKSDYEKYGKTTESTGMVAGLRAVFLTLGIVLSYMLLGGESMYSSMVVNNNV